MENLQGIPGRPNADVLESGMLHCAREKLLEVVGEVVWQKEGLGG